MEIETIFSNICAFVLANKASIVSKVIASATYDLLKKTLNFSQLKNRIKKFFHNEEDAEKYIETICNVESNNSSQPCKDIENSFEEVTGENFDNGLYNELQAWIEENKEQIANVSKMEFNNKQGFNIGTQNARGNIYNIQGDYNSSQD